jgi:hypothetical protein
MSTGEKFGPSMLQGTDDDNKRNLIQDILHTEYSTALFHEIENESLREATMILSNAVKYERIDGIV